jgi:aryl-alcohol dehydrogenase-like predicted oxidoreductase
VLPYCHEHGIPFFPYGALGGHDARMGRVSLARDFPRLARMAENKGVSPHQLALAYMRQKWPLIVHIVGARSKERVDELVKLGKPEGMVLFTRDEMDELDALG